MHVHENKHVKISISFAKLSLAYLHKSKAVLCVLCMLKRIYLAYSDVVCIYMHFIYTLLAPPSPVGTINVNSTYVDQLTVTWTPPTTGSVPTSCNVTINGSSSVVIADNGSPVYTHTFTGLVSDTLYTVSMVAINCAGASKAVLRNRRTCKELYCCTAVWPMDSISSCTSPESSFYVTVYQLLYIDLSIAIVPMIRYVEKTMAFSAA